LSKNAHWISDVVAGAGFGILSTELVYLTHQYKWDNEHIKNFRYFPLEQPETERIDDGLHVLGNA
jgi:membrane-associated phospholipid phosphatase